MNPSELISCCFISKAFTRREYDKNPQALSDVSKVAVTGNTILESLFKAAEGKKEDLATPGSKFIVINEVSDRYLFIVRGYNSSERTSLLVQQYLHYDGARALLVPVNIRRVILLWRSETTQPY